MSNQKEVKRLMRNLLKRRAVREYVEAVGGIGLPSKMPGTSYGISATQCGTGGQLAQHEGTVCHDCYAMRHNYTYPSVTAAHGKRWEALGNLVEWIENMDRIFTYLGAMLDDKDRFHRWHDSGDVRDARHLGAIVEIARRNPDWRFWLPTKEYEIVRNFVAQWDVPSNLVIRVSMPREGQAPTGIWRSNRFRTSTVSSGEGFGCPARNQGNECGTCRACWDGSIPNTDYPKH